MKPEMLKKGDKVAIVSLSRGLLGESFIAHETPIGIKRLEEYGLEVVFMPNSCKGMKFTEEHPEARAKDLKDAFLDKSIKAIICAIGGLDTYKTLPYLMEDDEFKKIILENPKIFMGFSDSTINHLMFNKLGLNTFYGPCFLVDLCELDKKMLPYTKDWFEKLFTNDPILEIVSSPIWYSDREDYSAKQIGVKRAEHKEEHGYEALYGNGKIEGKLIGGCIESIYKAVCVGKYDNQIEICTKYNLFSKEDVKDKILFLETSESKSTPEELSKILISMKDKELFNNVKGVILGKPIDEAYYEEYKAIYKDFFSKLNIPTLYNVNFGHSSPRCIIPYGLNALLDLDNKKIMILESFFEK
jgi:muramoyltetrapeptide carboxypeptidase LdcA involved in peptidoglycan recycling